MEAARSESPPSAPATNAGVKPEEVSPLKRAWVNMSATLQEHFRYFKASLYGLGKKVTARSEKEAAEADLQAAKMQVEAADAAEESKNKISQ
ncbi:hypothetical protein DCAR_0522112 [Daucus carota subsp. sativus]|uniref:Uncharacterized protein n=1 Tax=Daucus carota subsp. sativus TaxID=79200 RepID=A0A164ZLA8_DAUCS|nr:PREDICTED: uncharacterized protein LOC108222017 [Daucus carota subsp. sativus]WOH02723.1 hypothetical protein DCAR_0522112 [Daucus carota subsp. sativus]